MSAIVELTIFPTDKGDSVSPYVARVLTVIRDSGLPFELNPMGTCIEGEWPEIQTVIDNCFQALQPDCDRVYMTIKVDWRKDRTNGLTTKPASVRSKMCDA